MFKSCKIKLFPGDEWMFVRLNGPLPPPVENMGQLWEWTRNYPLSGQFMVRQNRVRGTSESGKFVLTATRWPEAFWGFSAANQELSFVSRGQWGGGGLKFGQTQTRFNPALVLHGAKMTDRGVEPISSSLTGTATVLSGGNMPMFSRVGATISWEWRSWDWSADQG